MYLPQLISHPDIVQIYDAKTWYEAPTTMSLANDDKWCLHKLGSWSMCNFQINNGFLKISEKIKYDITDHFHLARGLIGEIFDYVLHLHS